jgi:hypothetical protein
MKLSRTLLALFALSILALAGCTETLTNPASNTTLLTQYTWKTTKFTSGGVDQTAVEPKATKFNTDGTYTATKPDNSTVPGKWEFNVDETNITMDKGTASERSWEILILSSTALNLRITGPPQLLFNSTPQ